MAIIIEEERRGMSPLRILTWLIILGTIGFASYYIFFKHPQVVDVVVDPGLKNTAQLSTIKLNRATIDNDAVYNSLKSYITVPTEGQAGRLNPFLSF